MSGITDVQSFIEVMLQELIDVKDRKVLQSYPTLRWLYEAYLGLVNDCDLGPNQYTYCEINEFIGLVNTYWYELFEQVIPSTTIWGATTIYRNTVFDQQKFQYKRYSLFTCDDNLHCNTIGEYSGDTSVDVYEVPMPIEPITITPGVIPIDFPEFEYTDEIIKIDFTDKKGASLVKVDTDIEIFQQTNINLPPMKEAEIIKYNAYNIKLDENIKPIRIAIDGKVTDNFIIDVKDTGGVIITPSGHEINVGGNLDSSDSLLNPDDSIINPNGGVKPLCSHPCKPTEPTVIHCNDLKIYSMDDGSSFIGNVYSITPLFDIGDDKSVVREIVNEEINHK
jgi:hypothetical protein